MTNSEVATFAMPHPHTPLPDLSDSLGAGGLTAADADRIHAAIRAELADSSRESYAAGWRQWETWCRDREIRALPGDPAAVAAFLTERAEAGLCYGTLHGYRCAIAHRHHQEGLPNPAAHPVVRRVCRGLRRMLGTAPLRPAHPLTVAELRQIVSVLPNTTIGVRDRAILLLGYASAMRPGEISARDVADITSKPDGLEIAVRRSKTDHEGAGRVVGVAHGRHPETDPVQALRAWLKIRPAGDGALFTRIFHSGKVTSERLGPRAISRVVATRAAEAGFDEMAVGGHSLRAGHATTAALNGVPLDRIADQTGHRDLGTLMRCYVRPARTLARSSSRDLGL